jgi:AhpD family alkylhydroperoxidase
MMNAMHELDKKTRELVMIGAAVGANCETCWLFHYQQARKAGATHDEILAASRAGGEVRKFVNDRLDSRVEEARMTGDVTDKVSSCSG